MKTKLLVVCTSLGLGGSERCMLEMLRNIDLTHYEITLLALIPVENKNLIPAGIKVVNGYTGFEYCNSPMRQFVPHALKTGQLGLLVRKSVYWYKVSFEKQDFSSCFWNAFSQEIPNLDECYDVTIGYGPGLASFFSIDRVPHGGKKILWVNTNLVRSHFDLNIHRRLYENADYIVAVCKNLLKDLQDYYPTCCKKMHVFYDMLNVEGIRTASKAYTPNYPVGQKNRILTVGRICEAKALHLAAEAAAELKARGHDFHWYIIGDGADKPLLEKQIHELDIHDKITLLGAIDNPYPWFAECDIYVQTSVYEGSCTTISEALILGKPVITTNIDIAFEKICAGHNGLICDMTGRDIAANVESLLCHPEIKEEMTQYINSHPVFYGDQIKQFYELLEGAQLINGT